jgi:hypothetical protein
VDAVNENDGTTALMAAVCPSEELDDHELVDQFYNRHHEQRENVVRLLLDAGAHVNWEDAQERTALWLAVQDGRPVAAEMLLDRGAGIQKFHMHEPHTNNEDVAVMIETLDEMRFMRANWNVPLDDAEEASMVRLRRRFGGG